MNRSERARLVIAALSSAIHLEVNFFKSSSPMEDHMMLNLPDGWLKAGNL